MRQFSGVLCTKGCRPEKQTLENLRPWQFPAGILGLVKSGEAKQVRGLARFWPLE